MKAFLPFVYLIIGLIIFSVLFHWLPNKKGLNKFSGTRYLNRTIYMVYLSMFMLVFFSFMFRNYLTVTQYLWGVIGSLIVTPIYIIQLRSQIKKRLHGNEYIYDEKYVSPHKKLKIFIRILSFSILVSISISTLRHFALNISNSLWIALVLSPFLSSLYWYIYIRREEKRLGRPIIETIKDSDSN